MSVLARAGEPLLRRERLASFRRPAVTPRPASVSRMTTFAIANQKGGVGKTTTAVNLAACIAGAGMPALLVDLDPQCNATVSLGQPRTLRPNAYDVLCQPSAAAAAVHETPVDLLSLIPAAAALVGATVELPAIEGSERRLREALTPLRERFPFVLIDCPPSLGPLTINALVAADRVIVPVQTEYFALEGLAQILDTISLVQRGLNPHLTIGGLVLTMHDARTRLGRDVERDVREHFPGLVFETVIPRNVRLSEAPSFGVPVTLHDPYCVGAEAYVALAREVAARVG
jgi:chromosome partitioning protein